MDLAALWREAAAQLGAVLTHAVKHADCKQVNDDRPANRPAKSIRISAGSTPLETGEKALES